MISKTKFWKSEHLKLKKCISCHFLKPLYFFLDEKVKCKRCEDETVKLMKLFSNYKSTLTCKICNGKTDLTFHHLIPDEKTACISDLIIKTRDIKLVNEEIAKCLVLCERCHQDYHWEEKSKSVYAKNAKKLRNSESVYKENMERLQASKEKFISAQKSHKMVKEKFMAVQEAHNIVKEIHKEKNRKHKDRQEGINPDLTIKINEFRDQYEKNPPSDKSYVIL